MISFHRIGRIVRLGAWVVGVWAVACSRVWAQRSTEPVNPAGGSVTDYTLAYFLVALGIVLGMMFVVRTSSRRERDRPEKYKEKNLLAQED